MAWLRALQTSLWPVAPRPWQGGFDLLDTLACLDAHAWAGASGERAVCRWALAAANGLHVCRVVCRWPQAALNPRLLLLTASARMLAQEMLLWGIRPSLS